MINLLPPQGHKAVKREYILRVSATLAFLFGGVCILLTVALIPTFVLVRAQMSATTADTQDAQEETEMLLMAEKEVQTTQGILGQLKSLPQSAYASDIIAELQKLAPAGILFNEFALEKENGLYMKVQVSGVASTREALSEFRKRIEGSAMFAAAELPISDLARDANLPFALTVTIEKQQ